MIWLDAHLSPALATWLTEETGEPAAHLRTLGLRHAKVTCGNTSNEALRVRLKTTITRALRLVGNGEPLVEITDTGLA